MIAVISLRRSSIYQRFEYSVRLEVLDEIVQIGTSVGDQVQIASMGSGARREAPPSQIAPLTEKGHPRRQPRFAPIFKLCYNR